MANRFLKSGYATKYSLPSLRFILCAGAILKAKTQEELKCVLPQVQILQGYGKQVTGRMMRERTCTIICVTQKTI